MSRIDFPYIYNPANQSPNELIENFVVRTKIFADIFEDIKNSEMKHPEQHYIIQGVRGQGKTTLLLRLAYEIKRDKKLKAHLIPIVFNEEQYNVSRLYKLWETVAEYLEEDSEIQGLSQKMQQFENDDDYEQQCFNLLEDSLKTDKKKIILFIDNIDQMLTRFSEMEHHRLREVFIESAELRIIGASSVSLEFHYDYGQPFYQFFRMPQLKGLNKRETKLLLLKLGERHQIERVKNIIDNQPGRVEALRRMTGGVIRNIILMFEIFVDDSKGVAFSDLEKILDSVTPLYKHRMDKLPPQQQEIIDFIALNWDAVSTKEIAQKTKIESKAVSAQLKQLENHRIIEKEKTNTKNHLYRIEERFFNIWYLMRHGKKWHEKKVQFLVEFLQIWCDTDELENRAKSHIAAIKKGFVYERHAIYWTEALARTAIKRELQHELLSETRDYVDKSYPELKGDVSQSDYELKEAAKQAFQAKDFAKATQQLQQIKFKDEDDLNAIAYIYQIEIKDFNKAEQFYLKAVKKDHTSAMYNLAFMYETEFKDFKNAEQFYLKAVKKDDPQAMNSLAWMYFTNKIKKSEAIKYAGSAFKVDNNIYNAHTYATILLWNNEIKKAYKIAGVFLQDKNSFENFPDDIILFFLLLIAKKQYHLALNTFNNNPLNLKDRLKPVYYALMYFLQDEFPNEFRKMGGELKQTVDEIIKKISKLEKDYH